MRKIFNEDLIFKSSGKNIDWRKCVGTNVRFVYDGIEGEIYIVSYEENRKSHLTLKYKENILDMFTSHFKACKIGVLIGVMTREFSYKVGDTLKDSNRDITIVRQGIVRRCRGYLYKCNKCGFDGEGEYYDIKNKKNDKGLWVSEWNIARGVTCACCSESPQIVVCGINDIYSTDVYLSNMFSNIEESKLYTKTSSRVANLKCKDCGNFKSMKISDYIYWGFGCPICSDGMSFPEKVISSVLVCSGADFISQLSRKHFKWILNKRYDFFINKNRIIIETHGIQHYTDSMYKRRGRTLKQEQDNDRFKKELAISNGIKEEDYIIIDCRESNIDFIKNNILNSRLSELFDLSTIDWVEVDKLSQKSLVKEVCGYWSDKSDNETTSDLQVHFKLSRNTIIRYLKKGTKIGWCDYNPILEHNKTKFSKTV